MADFNPRSPRGLRLVVREGRTNIYLFQSTQPKRAATKNKQRITNLKYSFQSTQPKRAATFKDLLKDNKQAISIHAAQEGCDFYVFFNAPVLY